MFQPALLGIVVDSVDAVVVRSVNAFVFLQEHLAF
jgi:hypothetical protein